MNFDGTDDYVQTTFSGVFGTTPRTFEAWIKLPVAPNGTECITDYGLNAVGSRNTFIVNGSGFIGYISGGTNANITATVATVPIGSWVHVAFVYDGTNGFLYQNGVQVGTGSLTTVNTPTGATDFRVGQRVPGGSIPFNGNIDEVRVWNVAKTQADLQASMNTELTGNEASLVYYAKFDEVGASCDIVDCSPGQHHGTRLGTSGANNLPQFSTDVPAITDVACTTPLVGCTLAAMCSVDGISVSNISACNNQNTPDPSDDTFTANVTVTFTDAPSMGTLDLSGDGTATVPVGSLGMGTHTFTGVTMSADGSAISLTASFSADVTCTLTNSNAGTAPAACSMTPPPVCSVTGITVSNISACDSHGTPANITDDTFTADVSVVFSNPPASGTLNLSGDGTASVPVGSLGAGTYTFTGVTMAADGTAIGLTATFSAAPACTFVNANAGIAPANCSPDAPSIPTMSEWGLILFALILFTMVVVFGTQQQQSLALSGMGKDKTATTRQGLPFDKAVYFKVLPLVYLAFALLFATASLVFGYEMTSADLPGSLLSGGVIAYLIQFVLISSDRK